MTLVEVLMAITIMAIIAGAVLTQYDSASHDQLRGTAQIVAADLARARSLAVTNNSSYRITFDQPNNRYVLTHSGTNSALDNLPDSGFHAPGGSPTKHTTDLSLLPLGSGRVELAVVESSDPTTASLPERVLDIEFGPLGETSRASRTTIWISAGKRGERRFLGIEVDPITGLASMGTVQTALPDTLALESMNETE